MIIFNNTKKYKRNGWSSNVIAILTASSSASKVLSLTISLYFKTISLANYLSSTLYLFDFS